ncbi:MAG TPA: nucleotidyltransferase family protein [Gaiellaceae bacterium]|nr:nucleotidyltransferase family protein [Gaiellaceae bacterium]
MSRVAAVVLAAGESTRFGEPKQLLLLPGVLDRLARAPVDEIVVVEGAHRIGPVGERDGPPVRIVPAESWNAGPGASLRSGLAALGGDVDAAVVVLADGPNLSPAAVERVVDIWRAEGGIVAASYAGSRGHPLVLGRESWDDVPDEGLHSRGARLVPCDDLGPPGDVDTPADLPAS